MLSILRAITASVLMIVGIAGCTPLDTGQSFNTPTGKADVIIPNASKVEVADKITNAMLSANFLLESRDPEINVLTFVQRPSDTWLFRYTYNIVSHPPQGVRVVTTISRIMNPGRRDQTVTDLSRGSAEADSAYKFLTQLRDSYSHREVTPPPARAGLGMSMKDYTILSLSENGVAKQAGLRVGDVILKIDGEPTTGNEMKDASRINGTPGSTVKLLVKRNQQELVINLPR